MFRRGKRARDGEKITNDIHTHTNENSRRMITKKGFLVQKSLEPEKDLTREWKPKAGVRFWR